MKLEWLKGYRTKYKHLYEGKKALCGSGAEPWDMLRYYWKHIENHPKCPACLEIERERLAKKV